MQQVFGSVMKKNLVLGFAFLWVISWVG